MSDENREQEPGAVESSGPPSVGSQLKAAREARQMSVGDVAMALKLGSRQVEALESGNWQGLPGQTFIRGFVRNYARLLQVDPIPLMAQLDTVLESPLQRLTLPGQPQRQVAMPQAGAPRRRDYVVILAGLLLVAVATIIYFLLPADLSGLRSGLESVFSVFSSKEEAPPATAPVAGPEPLFPPDTASQQAPDSQAATPGEAAGGGTPETSPPPALVPPPVLPTPAPEQAAPPAAPSSLSLPPSSSSLDNASKAASLRFSFEQESWIEVRDRHGKLLLSEVNPPGTERQVDGEGPFALIVGNAPGVKLSLRGLPVDLASHTRGRVARLRLE